MKERPILFSGEMVRAILDGRKTQTRRMIKPQPTNMENSNRVLSVLSDCPFGKVGDRLWVREAWHYSKHRTIPYLRVSYKSTSDDGDNSNPWKPSIHMPRWVSRINLEITNIRVERLQDITEEDALSEGVSQNMLALFGVAPYESEEEFNFKQSIKTFRLLWESIYGSGSWDKNPWAWVIEFERIAI